jgi:hypothetical protein
MSMVGEGLWRYLVISIGNCLLSEFDIRKRLDNELR